MDHSQLHSSLESENTSLSYQSPLTSIYLKKLGLHSITKSNSGNKSRSADDISISNFQLDEMDTSSSNSSASSSLDVQKYQAPPSILTHHKHFSYPKASLSLQEQEQPLLSKYEIFSVNLAIFKNLKELLLEKCSIGQIFYSSFSRVSCFPCLESLEFLACQIDASLPNVFPTKLLKFLSVKSCTFSTKDYHPLLGVSYTQLSNPAQAKTTDHNLFPRLFEFEFLQNFNQHFDTRPIVSYFLNYVPTLTRINVSLKNDQALSNVSFKLPHLVSFTLSNSRFSPPSFTSLSLNLKILTLKNLNLDKCPNLSHLPNLSILSISSNLFHYLDNSIKQLQYLEELYLSNNCLSRILDLSALFRLRILDLSGNQLTLLHKSINSLFRLENLLLHNNQLDFFTLVDDYSNPQQAFQLNSLLHLNMRLNHIKTLPKTIGILATEARVLTLNLCMNKIISFPPSIGQFRHVHLENNKISSFPNSFTNFCIRSLHLQHNRISKVPTIITTLVHLVTLELDHNQISFICSNIGDLTKLSVFSVSFNPLKSLPKSVCQLRQLTILNLENTKLTTLPICFYEKVFPFPKINSDNGIILNNNQLIKLPLNPSFYENFSKLDLSHNSFVSPEAIQSMPIQVPVPPVSLATASVGASFSYFIRTLVVSHCNLKSIPTIFTTFHLLTYLDCSFNSISHISESLCKLSFLTFLDLSNNQIKIIPDCVCTLTNLISFHLHNNQISSLPKNFGSLIKITHLKLENNCLQTIPESLLSISHLDSLSLRNNQLTLLPPNWHHAKNLRYLLLDCNPNLSSLPLSLCSLPKLLVLSISHCNFTSLPPELSQLQTLSDFDFSFNKLSLMPDMVSNLPNLRRVSAFGNNFPIES